MEQDTTTRLEAAKAGAHAAQARTIADRVQNAKDWLVDCASSYANEPTAETWRMLCRAKATLDALLRVARR